MVFEEEFQQLAKKIPDAEAIIWQQYTPYFSDGDACVFSVGHPVVRLSNTDEDADYWDLDGQNLTKKQQEALDDVAELISASEMEDALLDIFGDHQEITYDIETGKFEQEDYDHD